MGVDLGVEADVFEFIYISDRRIDGSSGRRFSLYLYK